MSIQSQKQAVMPVNEFLKLKPRNSPNMSQPEILEQHYKCRDNFLQEPYYKIKNIAISKKDRKDNFIDIHVKNNNWQPGAAKYDLI